MKQNIDCFLACHQAGEVSHTVRQLEGSTAVSRVILLEGQPLQSSAMVMSVAEKASAPYVLIVMKPVPLTIGEGAIVGTPSVVTKDIPSFEVWAGNPARFIRKRKK